MGAGWRKAFKFAIAMFVRFKDFCKILIFCPWPVLAKKHVKSFFQEGFLLQDNGKRCTDIDECSGGLHNCSIRQVCQNSEGGFACIDEPEVTQCEVSPELTQDGLTLWFISYE